MTANTLPAQNPKPKRVFLIDLDSYNPEKLEGPALTEIAKNLACNLAAQDPTIDEIHIFSTKNLPETTDPLIMELVHKTNLTVECHNHEPISYGNPSPLKILNLIKNFMIRHGHQRIDHLGIGSVEYTLLNNRKPEDAELIIASYQSEVEPGTIRTNDSIVDTYIVDSKANPSLSISKEIRAMKIAKSMRDALKSIKDNVPAFYYFLKRKISSLIGGEPLLPPAPTDQTAPTGQTAPTEQQTKPPAPTGQTAPTEQQTEPPAPTDQTEHHPPNSLHQ